MNITRDDIARLRTKLALRTITIGDSLDNFSVLLDAAEEAIALRERVGRMTRLLQGFEARLVPLEYGTTGTPPGVWLCPLCDAPTGQDGRCENAACVRAEAYKEVGR